MSPNVVRDQSGSGAGGLVCGISNPKEPNKALWGISALTLARDQALLRERSDRYRGEAEDCERSEPGARRATHPREPRITHCPRRELNHFPGNHAPKGPDNPKG